jgi:hypothetical protein
VSSISHRATLLHGLDQALIEVDVPLTHIIDKAVLEAQTGAQDLGLAAAPRGPERRILSITAVALDGSETPFAERCQRPRVDVPSAAQVLLVFLGSLPVGNLDGLKSSRR